MQRLKFFVALLFILVPTSQYSQIIADHTIVDDFDNIPQNYIDKVKMMLVDFPGESHSLGYRIGLDLLEQNNNKFQVLTYSYTIPAYSEDFLRLGKHTDIGEADFYTSQTAIDSYKSHITGQNSTGNLYSVIGFAWCWDMTWENDPGGTIDPVYNVRWAGSSSGGPEGSLRWGLDDGDTPLTGNSVNMDTYLDAMEQYIQYCADNSYPTKMVFTTGPVDNEFTEIAGTENGFQREIKHDYIRNYVSQNATSILFDYADILCWNNSGEKYISEWNDNGTIRTHANIHPDNMMDYDASWNVVPHSEDGDHIGEVGTLRIAKAMWWMLARIAGWDGSVDGEDTTPPSVPSGLVLSSASLNSIEISWTASSDNTAVTGYNVFRNGAFLGTSSEPGYLDNTITECNQYTYTVSAFDAVGNESELSQGFLLSNCQPDLTPTLIVSPNISHGVTVFNVLVRVTELNNIDSNGSITINIPSDTRWDIEDGYNSSLEMLNGTALNNSDWNYSKDDINHIFSTSVLIQAGSSSTIGFTIVFNPDTSRGLYTLSSQLMTGSGGETRSSNNADSERLDYFQ